MRTAAAVLIACAFLLMAFGCSSHTYPVTGSAGKAQKQQQSRLQSQFP